MCRKLCGKRRNCSLRGLYCRHVKTRACLGKGQDLSGMEAFAGDILDLAQMLEFVCGTFENIAEKEINGFLAFSHLLTMFSEAVPLVDC